MTRQWTWVIVRKIKTNSIQLILSKQRMKDQRAREVIKMSQIRIASRVVHNSRKTLKVDRKNQCRNKNRKMTKNWCNQQKLQDHLHRNKMTLVHQVTPSWSPMMMKVTTAKSAIAPLKAAQSRQTKMFQLTRQVCVVLFQRSGRVSRTSVIQKTFLIHKSSSSAPLSARVRSWKHPLLSRMTNAPQSAPSCILVRMKTTRHRRCTQDQRGNSSRIRSRWLLAQTRLLLQYVMKDRKSFPLSSSRLKGIQAPLTIAAKKVTSKSLQWMLLQTKRNVKLPSLKGKGDQRRRLK